MHPALFRFHIRRVLLFLPLAVIIYLFIANSLVPARLKANKPRGILSVEQQQNTVLRAAVPADHVRANEEAFEELVQQDRDGAKERLRSPDPDLPRHNTSKISHRGKSEENMLISEVTRMDLLEQKHLNSTAGQNKSLCPDITENQNLDGPIDQGVLLITNLKEAEVFSHYPFIKPGGRWRPDDCIPRYKVAIIIPFRDRQSHLTRLLDFLIPILKKQMLDFRFIVTEQYGRDLFNKGRIMNAAFRFAETLGVDCVIFHDVDMFPQDDHTSYGCPSTPRHIGAYVNNLGYQLWYKEIVGGVLAINMNDYRTVNGYSNMYWAWGGEDDDMGKRILSHNMSIERPEDSVRDRFSMLKHVKRKRTAPKLIYKLLESADTRWATDGLNVTSWKVVKKLRKSLYYHLFVDVGTPPPEWRSES